MATSNLELTDTLSAPLGEFIASVARGVAEAQQAMDLYTIETYKEIYGSDAQLLQELREMGYQPTWYKIPEVSAEITMSLSISATHLDEGTQTTAQPIRRANKFEVVAAPVDANYVNRYNYNIQGASKVKFTIVPVPPSPLAEAAKIVPALAEKSLAEARSLLQRLEFPFELKDLQSKGAVQGVVDDSTPIKATEPKAGEMLVRDQIVTLYVES